MCADGCVFPSRNEDNMKTLHKLLVTLALAAVAVVTYILTGSALSPSTWDDVLFKAEDLSRVAVLNKKEAIEAGEHWKCVDAEVEKAIALAMTQSIMKARGGACPPEAVVVDVAECPVAISADAPATVTLYGERAKVIVTAAAEHGKEVAAWSTSFQTWVAGVKVDDQSLKTTLAPIPGCEVVVTPETPVVEAPVVEAPVELLPEVTSVTGEPQQTP